MRCVHPATMIDVAVPRSRSPLAGGAARNDLVLAPAVRGGVCPLYLHRYTHLTPSTRTDVLGHGFHHGNRPLDRQEARDSN